MLKFQEDVSFVVNTEMVGTFDDEAVIIFVPVDSSSSRVIVD